MDLNTLLKYSGVNNSEITQKKLEDNVQTGKVQTDEAVGQFADPIYDLIDEMGNDDKAHANVLHDLIRYLDGDTIKDFVDEFRRVNDYGDGLDEAERPDLPASLDDYLARFEVGDTVLPKEEGPGQAPGKCIKVDGDKCTVKFSDGSTEVFTHDELEATDAKVLNMSESDIDQIADVGKVYSKINKMKMDLVDGGMEPEDAQDEACEKYDCDPAMYDKYVEMKRDEREGTKEDLALEDQLSDVLSLAGLYKPVDKPVELATEEVVDEAFDKVDRITNLADLNIYDKEEEMEARKMSAADLKDELEGDIYHLMDKASDDFTDSDYIADEMGDNFASMHLNADDATLSCYVAMRDLIDEDPADVLQTGQMCLKILGAQEYTAEGKMSDMHQDAQENDKEDFIKMHKAHMSAEEAGKMWDEVQKQMDESVISDTEESIDESEFDVQETVEIAKDDLSALLSLAGMDSTQATTSELDEYANSPDEDYRDSDYMLNKMAGGLNGPKTQTDKGYPGDNPLAAKLAGKLQAMLDDLNK